jgi:hypothetical protein
LGSFVKQLQRKKECSWVKEEMTRTIKYKLNALSEEDFDKRRYVPRLIRNFFCTINFAYLASHP